MITFDSITKLPDGTWLFEWPATLATVYRVIYQGTELAQVTSPQYTAKIDGYVIEPPPIEVVEDDELSFGEQNKPFILLQWWPNREANHYKVQKFVSGQWQTQQSVLENDSAVYTVRSRIESDNDTVLYRVLAYDDIEQVSEALGFIALIVTPPVISDADSDVSYGSGDITVS